MNTTKIKDLQALFIERGYNPVIGTIYQQQEYWLSWYRGNVDGFHSTQKKNAEGRLIEIKKPSLQMAKKVPEDITSLLFNENVRLLTGEKKSQEVLDEVLKNTFFYDEMPNFVELTVGPYGTGVITEYIADDKTKVNYSFGDRVYVIDYENTTPTAIAIVQEFVKEKMKYTHVMYHTHRDGIYKIRHEMYSTKQANKGIGNPASLGVLFSEQELKEMRHEVQIDKFTKEVQYYIEYETDVAHFQVFKLGISNNYDVRSPLGISVYANSVSTLENIDEKYYSSRMDSINSRKRLFIDDEASKLHKTKDANGDIRFVKYFDQSETQFQTLKGMRGDGNKAIEFYAPMYDSKQHDDAIQTEFNFLSDKSMLGPNYYSYKDGVVGYQNELSLALSNGPLRRNRNKNLNRLGAVLLNFMKSVLFLEKEIGNYKGELENLDYSVQFDDDIFVDDATILAQYKQDAEDGVIPYWRYVALAYKLSEEEAKEWVEQAQEDSDNRNLTFMAPLEEEPEDGEES